MKEYYQIKNIKSLNKLIDKQNNLESTLIYLNGEFEFNSPNEINTIPYIKFDYLRQSDKNELIYQIRINDLLKYEIQSKNTTSPLSICAEIKDLKSIEFLYLPLELLIYEPRLGVKNIKNNNYIYILNPVIQIIENKPTLIQVQSVKFSKESKYNSINKLKDPEDVNDLILEIEDLLTDEEKEEYGNYFD